MRDRYRVDSHKLHFHVKRVSDWLDGKDIYPIYVEISTIGRCNHRCIFCSFDYLNYKGPTLEKQVLLNFLKQGYENGLKSVMYAGEGEPLLHPSIVSIINETKKIGIDVAVTTNGIPFSEKMSERCIKSLSWIKFSVDAAHAETYARIHRCKESDFHRVLSNIERVVSKRFVLDSDCRIGLQMLLVPENEFEVYEAAEMARSIGVDYFVVKPFTLHPMGESKLSRSFAYDCPFSFEDKIYELDTDKFDIVIRKNTMSKVGASKTYSECLGYRFWAYLDSCGDLYACSAFLGNKDYCYGNIYECNLKDIWNGQKRKEVIERMSCVDVSKCREICRLDEINRYLWELMHPSSHVNFL